MNGVCVGWSTPPAPSTVTATIAPSGTGTVRGTTVWSPPPEKSPAATAWSSWITHASYVFSVGRLLETADHELALARLVVDDQHAVRAVEREVARARVDEGDEGLVRLLLLGLNVVELPREVGRPEGERDSGDSRSDGHGGCDGERPAPARKRDDLGTLGGRLVEDPLTEPRGWPGCLDVVRELCGHPLEGGHVLAALGAVGEVLLERLEFASLEGVESVRGAQFVDLGSFHGSSSNSPSASCSRRLARPENIRLLIVPKGSPRRSASSDCVNPP